MLIMTIGFFIMILCFCICGCIIAQSHSHRDKKYSNITDGLALLPIGSGIFLATIIITVLI